MCQVALRMACVSVCVIQLKSIEEDDVVKGQRF